MDSVMKAQPTTDSNHTHIEIATSDMADQEILPVKAEKTEEARVITDDDVQKYSEQDDDAMKAFAEYEGPPLVLNEATNKRLLRKIDWHLMPILCIVFGLNYLDKTSISYASIMGIKKDINLVGDDYQWLGSIFYIGFLIWEYPTNRLLQRLPLAKYAGFCVAVWGLILALFAIVTNFAGAMAVRFLLGVFEAATMPSFALLSSQWYTVKEHNSRTCFWIGSNGGGQIVGGLIAYGIARSVSSVGAAVAGWKIIFIALGCFTTFIGILFFYIVPDSQLNCRWLDKRDRLLAIERVRENEQGIGNRHFKWYQFCEALLDPFNWALFLYGVVSDIPNGGITNFFSQLIVSFGFTEQESLLYGIPGGAVVIIACVSNGLAGDYFKKRTLVACIPMLAAMLGMLLMIVLPTSNNVGRLIGYYLTQALPAPNATALSLVSSNVAGYTKKTTVAAIYMIGYCTGNIIGPQVFRPHDAPHYIPAKVTLLACFAFCIADLLFINWWCRRENKRKAAIRAAPGYVRMENQGWRDLTDRENPEFIYAL